MARVEEPPAVHQMPQAREDFHEDCPFCTIASNFQPIDIQDLSNQEWNPDKLSPPSYVLLSTEHVLAFLDIAPLTRGHVLVAPRKHRTKMGDFRPEEMAEIGRLLPLLARTVIRAVLPDIPHNEADYNIVQNNGPGAAQVVPHVHFHIVPRPPLNYKPPSDPKSSPNSTKSTYPPSALPTGIQQSYIQFGRGRRHELDDDDAVSLIQTMRQNMQEEWIKEFGAGDENEKDTEGEEGIARFMGGIEDAAWIEGSGGLVSNLARRGRGMGKL